jgi:hypothetical protein
MTSPLGIKLQEAVERSERARSIEALERRLIHINLEYQGKLRLHDWLEMITIGGLESNNVLRVEVNADNTINLLDFGMPSKNGRSRVNVPQDNVPRWIMEAISILRITDNNTLVPELGFKVSDLLYYVVNQEGERND